MNMFAFAANYEVRPVALETKPAPAQEKPENSFNRVLKNTADQRKKESNVTANQSKESNNNVTANQKKACDNNVTPDVEPEKIEDTNSDNNLLIALSADYQEQVVTLPIEPADQEPLPSIESGFKLEDLLAQVTLLLEEAGITEVKNLDSHDLDKLKARLAEILSQNSPNLPAHEIKVAVEEVVTNLLAIKRDEPAENQARVNNVEAHTSKVAKEVNTEAVTTLTKPEIKPKKVEESRLNENKAAVKKENHNTTDIKRLMVAEANRFNGIKPPAANGDTKLMPEPSTQETNDNGSMPNPNISPGKLDAATMKLDTQFTAMVNKQVEAQELIDQIVKKAELLIKQNASEIKIDLKPEFLGKMTIKLVVEEGVLTARFLTENQQVKHLLESNLNTLRQSLEAQGIRVEKTEVNVQLNNGGLFDGSESGRESKGEEPKFLVNYLPKDPEEDFVETPAQFISSSDAYQEAAYQPYENPSLSFLI